MQNYTVLEAKGLGHVHIKDLACMCTCGGATLIRDATYFMGPPINCCIIQ